MSRKLFYYNGADLVFGYHNQRILDQIKQYSKPVWLYQKEVIQERIQWIQSWPQLGRLHYAMKANFHPEILKLIKENQCGIDAVSLGEMTHAVACGFTPQDIILSGVAKTRDELTWAIQNEIYQINIESPSELAKIIEINKLLQKKISLSIRVNPEVDAETHPGIATALKDSKFGLDFKGAEILIRRIADDSNLQLKAISFHIGSQILNVNVFEKAIQVVKPFYQKAKTLCPELERLDLGGGVGIDYMDADSDKDLARWKALEEIYTKELRDFDAFLILEIGRFLVARSGVLISRVEIIKQADQVNYLILDAGMSLLIRPALYDACHEVLPLKKSGTDDTTVYTVVGPICESSDVFATNKKMQTLSEGDLVAICDAGAYGSSMSSRYNLREPAEEIFI
ncbi:MAG: diaminopimelate decarboxylase [Bdellovibrionales bacterium RIFCSPHIGHO2_01_FULL_40_29]|nr:MAG: diaminopimelate decarboxylase [Bdellovibrionales bacterium RIFCSPHIGHO2_01_FULL_40_29]OFZ35580.1 MAG: diaminopimelate decarboxylase [Bdellovibrionales bacterium RIFCSPHIGHO2_02_FULL_40_15]